MSNDRLVMLSIHALGDTLMFLPTIRAVARHFSRSQVTVLVRNYTVYELLQTADFPDNVMVDYFKSSVSWKFNLTPFKPVGQLLRVNPVNLWAFHRLVALSPDVTIVMTKMNQRLTPAIVRLATSRVSVGEAHGWGGRLYTHPVLTDPTEHRVLRNLRLLKPLEVPVPDQPDIGLYPDRESTGMAIRLLRKMLCEPGTRTVAITPCVTLNQPWRLWPCRYWAKLIDLLVERLQADCFILGGPSSEERSIGKDILRNVTKQRRVHNLVGALSIREAIAFISLMDCVCGIDCGLLHIAAAVDTFVYAIWSATPVQHYPFTNNKQIIAVDCQCREDYPRNIRRECLKNPRCLDRFVPEIAFEKIASVWVNRHLGPKVKRYS